jgi:hypothetical protein
MPALCCINQTHCVKTRGFALAQPSSSTFFLLEVFYRAAKEAAAVAARIRMAGSRADTAEYPIS